MKKAYLIDPEKKEVTEVFFSGLDDIYRLTGCDCIDVARLSAGEGIYVDDNGLLKEPEFFFWISGFYPHPLAGRGLFVGPVDRDGYEKNPVTVIEDVRKNTVFLTAGQVGAFWHGCGGFE